MLSSRGFESALMAIFLVSTVVKYKRKRISILGSEFRRVPVKQSKILHHTFINSIVWFFCSVISGYGVNSAQETPFSS